MSFAFVFPGQGSQSVGMLGALAAADPSVRGTLEEASAVLGFDLWRLVSEGPEEALNATERTQPAMLAAGVATWRVWRARGGALPAVVSGHSLGEFTALVCAEAMPFGATVDLVRFHREINEQCPHFVRLKRRDDGTIQAHLNGAEQAQRQARHGGSFASVQPQQAARYYSAIKKNWQSS